MPLHKPGKLLFPVLLLVLSSCRSSQPPALSIVCIGDGFGGADCVDSGGNKVYKPPSQLVNYWMTTEVDEQNFTTWCYGSNSSTAVQAGMQNIKEKIK